MAAIVELLLLFSFFLLRQPRVSKPPLSQSRETLCKYNIVNLISKFIFIKNSSCIFSKLNYICCMIQGQTVIVISLDSYNNEYSEKVPFKAILYKTHKNSCICYVKSLVTENEYELDVTQILEGLPINEISNMLNLEEYGNN